MTTTEEPFSDGAYEMLHAAVNIARFERFTKLEDLVKALHKRFPERSEDVTAAVAFWKSNPPALS